MKTRQIFQIVITAMAMLLTAGHSARAAENGWSVQASTSGNVTTFTISRTNTSVAETVRYRLVNLSAFAGQHYNVTKVNGANSSDLTGEFTFAAGDATSRTVTVTEQAALTDAYKYQTGTTRNYKLELTDAGGFYLTQKERNITTGTSVTSSGVFDIKDVTIQTSEYTANDDGYDANGYKSVGASSYCTTGTQAYLGFLNAQLRMTLSFDAKENDDAYEYLQLLVDNTSTCDNRSDASNGDPGTPSLSRYMAGFEMDKGDKDATYRSYTFPVTSVGDGAGATNPWGYGTDWPLSKQRFKSGCRATDGRIIIPTNFSTLVLRLNASGSSGSDEWAVKNVKAHIQAVDATAPTVLGISVAPGEHAKGNTVYVTVAFSEIVKVTGTPKLTTNNSWGDLNYVTGTGTNVLTFSGTIGNNASGSLNVTGLSGTVEDLAGNDLVGSGVTANNLCSLDANYVYTLTYDLDGGSVATENSSTYTYGTASFTLNNPVKPGYSFDGWTGSNGSTPQTTVTIANHSHGNKNYTANWTQVWTGSGTQGDPYTITTTKGLDLLAQYVNSGNTCSELFFQLGSDITYTHTTAWDNAASTENNFTAIGNGDHPFQGTYDGGGHAISGIRIYKGGDSWADEYQGLFGNVSSGGTVRGVTLADARITGFSSIGGIAGHTFNSTIEDCTVGADVCIHAVQNSTDHGGIVGFNQANYVRRCISSATLTVANGLTGCKDFGGIVGNTQDTITDCIAEGAVIPDVKGRGAIVGYKYSGTLTRNYYRGCKVASDNVTPSGVGQGTSDSSTETSDVNGAQALYSLTLPSDVTLVRTASATLPGTGNATYTTGADIDGVPYAFDGASLTLSYTGSIPDGGSVIYKVNGTAIDGNSFTMPAQDVTITTQLLSTVSYIDANGNAASQAGCIPIGNANFSQSYGEAGQTNWYYVSGDVSTEQLTFKDASANIILCDGATLNISVTSTFYGLSGSGGSISIFAQSGGTGVYNFSGGRTCINAHYNVDINGATITGDNCDYGISASNGDVTIRGGNVNVSGKYAGIYARNNINITGGIVSVSGQDGMVSASNRTITLGYTSASDRITASSYACPLKVADGQTLTDGTAAYTGTLTADQIAAIAGRTLRPYAAIPDQLTLVQGTRDGVTAYWGTFYASGSGYTLPAGAAAYTMDAKYHLYRLGTDGSVIPKGTAVVIMADQATISLTTSDNAQATDNAPGGNILVGRDVATEIDRVCALSVSASGAVGFYPLSGIALPAHKAGYVPEGGLKDYHKEDGQQW